MHRIEDLDGTTSPVNSRSSASTDSRHTLIRNLSWNWAGTAVQMGSGLVVAPFLVRTMGDTGYGMWILIGSLTGYFDLLDLGVRASLGRTMALHRAQQDQHGLNAVLSTGLVLQCIQGLVVFAGTLIAMIAFIHLFEIPPDQLSVARSALLLVAINLATMYVLSTFDAVIWSMERFDLMNAVDIPCVLTRMLLTFALVTSDNGLVTLAWITLAVTVFGGCAKALVAIRIDRNLRFDLGSVSFHAARSLFGYGFWCFMWNMSRNAVGQLGPMAIGSQLAVGLVTPFSIAARLVGYSKTVQVASTGIFTPMSTTFHAQDRHADQRRLFVNGGRHCLALAVFFVGYFILLGGQLLDIWIGPRMQFAYPLLVIMCLGELLPMSQGMTISQIMGMAKHRALALAGIAELITVLALIILLIGPYGLVGAAIAFAVPAAVFRGVVPMLYSLRFLKVSFVDYARQAVVPVACLAAGPLLAIGLLAYYRPPKNWFELVLSSALYTVCYCGAGMVSTFGIKSLNPFRYARLRTLLGIPEH